MWALVSMLCDQGHQCQHLWTGNVNTHSGGSGGERRSHQPSDDRSSQLTAHALWLKFLVCELMQSWPTSFQIPVDHMRQCNGWGRKGRLGSQPPKPGPVQPLRTTVSHLPKPQFPRVFNRLKSSCLHPDTRTTWTAGSASRSSALDCFQRAESWGVRSQRLHHFDSLSISKKDRSGTWLTGSSPVRPVSTPHAISKPFHTVFCRKPCAQPSSTSSRMCLKAKGGLCIQTTSTAQHVFHGEESMADPHSVPVFGSFYSTKVGCGRSTGRLAPSLNFTGKMFTGS